MIDEAMILTNAQKKLGGIAETPEERDVKLRAVAAMLLCSMSKDELLVIRRGLKTVSTIEKVSAALELVGFEESGGDDWYNANSRVIALIRKTVQQAFDVCVKSQKIKSTF